MWFRTGFENTRSAWPPAADRQRRVDDRGRVVYGDWVASNNEHLS